MPYWKWGIHYFYWSVSSFKFGFPHCATSRRSKTTKPKPVKFFQPNFKYRSLCSLVFFPPGILCDIKKKLRDGIQHEDSVLCQASFYMCLTILDPTTFALNIYRPATRPKLCLLPGTQSFGFRVVNESHVLTQANLQTSPTCTWSMVTLFPTGDPKDSQNCLVTTKKVKKEN